MEKIKNFLKELDLNEKDIKVYLTGFRHGPIYASRLAMECKLTRPNVYDVLKKLEKMGLCYRLGALYGRKFKMANPSDIQILLNRKKKEYEELEEGLSSLLPAFSKLGDKESIEYPHTEYFEGVEGLKTILEKTLDNEEKLVRISASLVDFIDLLGDEFTKYYVKKRGDKGIKTRAMRFMKGEVKDYFFSTVKKYGVDVRHPPKGIDIKSTLIIWDDKVAVISSKKDGFGVLIQSLDYATTMKGMFDFIWKGSTSFKKPSTYSK